MSQAESSIFSSQAHTQTYVPIETKGNCTGSCNQDKYLNSNYHPGTFFMQYTSNKSNSYVSY